VRGTADKSSKDISDKKSSWKQQEDEESEEEEDRDERKRDQKYWGKQNEKVRMRGLSKEAKEFTRMPGESSEEEKEPARK